MSRPPQGAAHVRAHSYIRSSTLRARPGTQGADRRALASHAIMHAALKPAPDPPCRARAVVVAIAVTLLCAVIAAVTYNAWRQQARTHLQNQVLKETAQLRARMEGVLHANLHLTTGLAAFVTTHPGLDQQEFSTFAARLLESGKHVVKNFTYAPDHVIRHVFPVEGNEAAIGLDLSAHPAFAGTVDILNRTANPVLAGPHRLVQGGEGLIAREPLFRTDPRTGTRIVWGQVSMPMDMDAFYHQAGVGEFAHVFRLAIRGRDGKGADGEVFFGDPTLFDADPVLLQVSLPGGAWELAAKPMGGWTPALPPGVAPAAGLMLVLVFLVSHRMTHQGLLLRRSDKRMRAVGERLAALLTVMPNLVIVVDEHGRHLEVFGGHRSPNFPDGPDALLDRTMAEIFAPEKARNFMQVVHNVIRDDTPHSFEYALCDADLQAVIKVAPDSKQWFRATVVPLHENGPGGRATLWVIDDITERKRREAVIRHQALHDSLTGLPNRMLLIERLHHAINMNRRLNRMLALLYIDLDNFKPVNDEFGHSAGDQVLCEIARRLQAQIRDSDTAARIGGDEFIVLIESADDLDGVHVVADKLLTTLSEPICVKLNGREILVRVGASIGIALGPRKGSDVDALLQQADKALYAAKAAGKGCISPGSGVA